MKLSSKVNVHHQKKMFVSLQKHEVHALVPCAAMAQSWLLKDDRMIASNPDIISEIACTKLKGCAILSNIPCNLLYDEIPRDQVDPEFNADISPSVRYKDRGRTMVGCKQQSLPTSFQLICRLSWR